MFSQTFTRIYIIAIAISLIRAEIKQSLAGEWTFSGKLEGEDIQGKATVPGGIYSDLMATGMIRDIFYGYAVDDYKEIGRSPWRYSSTFIVDKELLSKNVVNLVFEGLDTFASILVNDQTIGESDNMFVRYVFDVKEYLTEGENEIEVRFVSPVEKAAQLADEQNKNYTIPPECNPKEYDGECNFNQIRKMQSSFSWDWGPSFPSVGIWKDVYLEAFNTGVVRYVLVTPKKPSEGSNWVLEVTSFLDLYAAEGQIQAVVIVKNGEQIIASSNLSFPTRQQDHKITLQLEIPEEKVLTWWPNGMGNQPLYELTVKYTDSDEASERIQKVGFRTIELVQEKDGDGLSFYFKVNSIPFFAKGANEIPVSVLPERQSDAKTVDQILQNAKETNMNMIRVWGGGVYESDYFYQKTSELGILVWQDFMFACALYPVRDDYLKSVTEEIRHQVRRLNSYPSVVLWAGNNENEKDLQKGFWSEISDNYEQYKADYIKLYHDVIQTELMNWIPEAIFVYSSPTNGLGTESEGYLAENPSDPLFGDVHFYNYVADSWETTHFPIPRFSSEYGYQSMPSLETWLTVTEDPMNLLPNSTFLNNRQHHPSGNTQNIDLIKIQLELPEETHPNFVEAFIYYSQIIQAQSVKVETEHYRSYTGRVDASGKGNTMGALYWQLNDIWVGPTWSGVDFTGKWKMLQYFAKDFFAPSVISATKLDDVSIEVCATTDLVDGLEEAMVMIHVWKWDSVEPATEIMETISLDYLKTVTIPYDIDPLLSRGNCGNAEEARKNCLFHFHLMSSDMTTYYSPNNYLFLEKLKNSNLANATVEISSVSATEIDKTFEIITTTDAVALFVWLDSHSISGRFSTNGYLQIHAEQSVEFFADQPTTVEELRKVLTVTHLRDRKYL